MKHFLGEKEFEPCEFVLPSCAMANTPGILRWAINGYKFKKDRKALLKVFVEGYGGAAPDCYDALLQGKLPYTVTDNEEVIFTGWKEAA